MPDALPSATDIPSADTALATIKAAELVMAKHREEPFAALVARVQAADLAGIAADFRTLQGLLTAQNDRQLFGQRADMLAAVPKFLEQFAAANAAQLKAGG